MPKFFIDNLNEKSKIIFNNEVAQKIQYLILKGCDTSHLAGAANDYFVQT